MTIHVIRWTNGFRGIVLVDNQMAAACVQVHNNRNAAIIDADALRRNMKG